MLVKELVTSGLRRVIMRLLLAPWWLTNWYHVTNTWFIYSVDRISEYSVAQINIPIFGNIRHSVIFGIPIFGYSAFGSPNIQIFGWPNIFGNRIFSFGRLNAEYSNTESEHIREYSRSLITTKLRFTTLLDYESITSTWWSGFYYAKKWLLLVYEL